MKKSLLLIIAASLLLIVSVSAFWPFSNKGVTGNAVSIGYVHTANCVDHDGPDNQQTEASYIEYESTYIWDRDTHRNHDYCSGGMIWEFSCEDGKKVALLESCAIGYRCEPEVIQIAGKDVNAGKCVEIEHTCTELSNGVKTHEGIKYNKCEGKTSITYKCEGTEAVKTSIECPANCLGAGLCKGTCVSVSEGKVTVDGKEMTSKCLNTKVLQKVSCENSALKTENIQASSIQVCETTNGIGSLRTSASTTQTAELAEAINTLETTVSVSQTQSTTLEQRITALETKINCILANPTDFSSCA